VSTDVTTSSRIAATFAACREQNRAALMPYLTTGYPTLEASANLLDAIVDGGGDLIELGVPFSDPLADGTTVQATSQKALDNGVTLGDSFELVRAFRARGHETPVMLMGYTNPFYQYGIDRLADDAKAAGVDGFIIPDLPSDESEEFQTPLAARGLDLIYMLAPTSTERRIRDVGSRATGFIYCVALTGVTGARDQLSIELPDYMARVRAATDVPLVIGFGISTPEHVSRAAELADGVIVASAMINYLDTLPVTEQPDGACSFLRPMADATVRAGQ
jgi:tryptophan synthase alpha chain